MYDLIMEQNDYILLRSTRLLSDVGVGEGVVGSCSRKLQYFFYTFLEGERGCGGVGNAT